MKTMTTAESGRNNPEQVKYMNAALDAPSKSQNGYANDTEMLRDYFALIEMLRNLRNCRGDEAKAKTILRQANRQKSMIANRQNNSQTGGKTALLISAFNEHHLNQAERLIVATLCYFQACNGESYINNELYDVLCAGDRMKMIGLNHLLSPGGRLVKSGLVYYDKKHPAFNHKVLMVSNEISRNVLKLADHPNRQVRECSNSFLPGNPQSPRQIYDLLARHVVGQEEAKRILAVAAYNHVRRGIGQPTANKANVMMIGPTGCGKTYLVEVLSQILDLPLFMADATQYSETGYVGLDVGSMFAELLRAADGDGERAANGIIFIDEIDKLAATWDDGSHHSQRDVSGKSVQEELLRAVESGGGCAQYDATGVLFIAGGAFSAMRLARARVKETRIGFGSDQPAANVSLDNRFTVDEFVRHGMMPELMGRFPMVVQLDPLDEQALARILTEPENSVLGQYQRLFASHGVTLTIPKETVRMIAARAAAIGTGARGLRAVVEQALAPLMFEHFDARTTDRTIELLPEMLAQTNNRNEAKETS